MPKMSINLGLTALPEVQDPKTILEFTKLYNAVNILGVALDRYTGHTPPDAGVTEVLPPQESAQIQNLTKVYLEVGVDIPYGGFITIYNDAGTSKIKHSNGLAGPQFAAARGLVSKAYGVGEMAEVFLFGVLPVANLTPGAIYYIHTSIPGAASPSPSSQKLGWAIDDDSFFFTPELIA